MNEKQEELGKMLKLIRKNKKILEEKYSVSQIAVFGSYAKCTQKKTSDIDILVNICPESTIFDFLRLENYLSDLLMKKVDLGTFASTKEVVEKQILSDLIYV
jgi:hypothetical protein